MYKIEDDSDQYLEGNPPKEKYNEQQTDEWLHSGIVFWMNLTLLKFWQISFVHFEKFMVLIL